MSNTPDSVLILSFGGPEKSEDVLPFLGNVLRGRNVPRERLLEVAEHYYHFGGRSPINDQNRELIAALRVELERHGIALPVYWGNRNWHPLLADTLREMRADGVDRAVVFVTSAFSSYSGCRQYLEDMDRARAELGPGAPELEKLRGFHDHPGFIASVASRVAEAFEEIAPEQRGTAKLLFTAHSIPLGMADTSPYVGQLREACELVARAFGRDDWELAFQSRSGPPGQPWLEPDVRDALKDLRARLGEGAAVVVSPIGFISDHMEVVYDLDTEAKAVSEEVGLRMVRARTPGVDPRFVTMIRELIEERLAGGVQRSCAANCCPAPRHR